MFGLLCLPEKESGNRFVKAQQLPERIVTDLFRKSQFTHPCIEGHQFLSVLQLHRVILTESKKLLIRGTPYLVLHYCIYYR